MPRAQIRDFTEQEEAVLRLVENGKTNAEIAERLGISLDDAKGIVNKVIAQLGVDSREAAGEAWRHRHSMRARMRGLAGPLLGLRGVVLAGAAVGLVITGSVFVLGRSDEAESTTEGPSLQQLLDAIRVPGKVFYTESDMRQGTGTTTHLRMWYSADDGAARTESQYGTGPAGTMIYSDDRQASYDADANRFIETPPQPRPKGMPDGAIGVVPHIGFFAWSDSYRLEGEEDRDGERVYRFEAVKVLTQDEASEQTPGTTLRYTVFLGTKDLLPRAILGTVQIPGKPKVQIDPLTYSRLEFVDRSSLPPDFFDRSALAHLEVTPQQALVTAGRQPYATFWLGPRLEVPWATPNGDHWDHQEVVSVGVKGVGSQPPGDIVTLGYGPPAFSLTLLDIRQGPVNSFEPLQRMLLEAIRVAGNVHPLPSGNGYVYAQYFPRGQCGFEQAQGDAKCRSAMTPVYGAVVEMDGTRVHVVAAPKFDGASDTSKDTNPFSSEAAILELAGRLQRLP